MKAIEPYRAEVKASNDLDVTSLLDEMRFLVINDFSELNFVIGLNSKVEIDVVVQKIKHLFYKVDQLEGVILCNDIVKESDVRIKVLKCRILFAFCCSLYK